MAKLNMYMHYYMQDEYDSVDNYSSGDDYDLLKWAFCKLCEQELTPGKPGYNEYASSKRTIQMYTEKMLTGDGFGYGKGKFQRVG